MSFLSWRSTLIHVQFTETNNVLFDLIDTKNDGELSEKEMGLGEGFIESFASMFGTAPFAFLTAPENVQEPPSAPSATISLAAPAPNRPNFFFPGYGTSI
jgi:hypothetical protein